MPNQKQTWALFSATAGGEAAPGPTPLENEYSLEFDGVDDYLDCGTLSSLVDNKSKLSISLWVKFTNAGVTNRVTGKYVGLNKWLAISGTSDTISFVVSGVGTSPSESLAYVQSNAVLSDNTWHHVVCVFDGTQGTANDRGKIYIDGDDESASYNNSFPSTTYNFASEGSPPNWNLARNGYAPTSDELEGKMDEYSIYSDVALTPTMIGEIYNSGLPANLNTLATAPTPDLWYRNGDSGIFRDSQWDIPDQMKIDNFSNLSTETNAVSSRVDCGNDSSLDMSGGVVSLSAWVNFDSLGNYEGIAGKRLLTNLPLCYLLSLDNTSKMRFFITQSDNTYKIALSDSTANTGQWYHLLGVADGTNVKLYVDGVLQSTTDTYDGTLATTTDSFYMGRNVNYFLDGKVDDVAVFNTDKSSSASGIYNFGSPSNLFGESGLVAYWRMGEDAVYNGSHYQYPDYTKKDLFSQKSFEFDGVNEYISLGDTFDLGTFTISAWINAHTISGSLYEGILSKRGTGGTSDRQFNLSLDTANKVYFWLYQSDGTAKDIASNSAIVVDTWYHIMIVADGTNLKMYVDGVLQTDTDTYDGTFQDTGETTKIGVNGFDEWDGLIDDVAIFNSAKAIGDIWDGSGAPTDLSAESGLVGYWTFDDSTFSTQWSIPDNSPSGTNTGTSVNMQDYSLRFISPTNPNRGRSENINQDGVVNQAPNNTTQGRSVNMTESDRSTDVPT